MSNQEYLARAEKIFMNNVGRIPRVFVRGEGSKLYDADGVEYLDFLTGIAVESFGHSNPEITGAIQEQAETIVHVSNYFFTDKQIIAGEMLLEYAGMDRVFFANSGAEANEAALKLARKYGKEKLNGRYEIITAINSFHGRTFGALAATGQSKYQEAFRPLPEGFIYAPFNDLDAWEKAITPNTCALMIEPVQGEGGVYPATEEFIRGLKKLCDLHGLLLIFDEIQTGLGRTGQPFAWHHWGIRPHILTTGKSIGGGVPFGAMMAVDECCVFTPGDHSTTIGGGSIAWAAAIAVLRQLKEKNIAERAAEYGRKFQRIFMEWKQELPVIKEIRGLGMMMALELTIPAKPVMLACLEHGLIVNAVSEKAIRMQPPLLLTEEEMEKGLDILYKALVNGS